MRNVISFTSTIFMMVILCGTEKARAEDASLPTPPLQEADKVIYGADDRRDIFQDVDPDRREWANSVCALVHASQLTEQEDGTYSLAVGDYTVEDLPPCESESFRDQPTAARCTGFIVGPNLIATAGHCFGSYDLDSTYFVFGFRMLDPWTARTTFEGFEVYQGYRIVAHRYWGDYNYTIIRVNRRIEVPGAQVLRLRTYGTVPEGTPLGVIGHPAGLPLKTAFGRETMVIGGLQSTYFFANLDAYSENAGSPVINPDTGLVEGMLTRGPADYDIANGCFRSQFRSDSDHSAQVVTRSTVFSSFAQPARGTVTVNRSSYKCGDTMEYRLYDLDLSGATTAEISVRGSGGDEEIVTLAATELAATFIGMVNLAQNVVAPGDGLMQAGDGEIIIATYLDEDAGRGIPGNSVAVSRVDCTVPEISDVRVTSVGGRHARIAFKTNEPTWGVVSAGQDCESLDHFGYGNLAIDHEIQVEGLEGTSDYFFNVSASDTPDNFTTADNDGNCFAFTTTDQRDFLTQVLENNNTEQIIGLEGRSITYTPDGSSSGYSTCIAPADSFPTSPLCGSNIVVDADGSVEHWLKDGHNFTFFGQEYSSFFVGENGYVAFGDPGTGIEPLLESHFAVPRISGYFANISSWHADIRIADMDDRVAITYYNVLDDIYNGLKSFQIELFYSGEIRITWVVFETPSAIVGLSDGSGLDPDFAESDLSAYPICENPPPTPILCDATVPNDACTGAIPVSPRQVYNGSTQNTVGSAGLPGCDYCDLPDVWFSFKPLITGEYVIYNKRALPTSLRLYDGECDELREMTDISVVWETSLDAEGWGVNLTAGKTYLIRVASQTGRTGDYEFWIDFGSKGSFGCNAGSGTPRNPWTEILIACGLVTLLAWRTRERRTQFDS